MIRFSLLNIIIIQLLFISNSFSQTGSVSGKITDVSTAEPLIGATVAILNTTNGTITDFDGKYLISGLSAGNYSIKITYVGYEAKEISGIEIKNGQITIADISLSEKKENTLNEIIVKGELKKENIQSMLTLRKNSAVVSDAISADMIKKSPDKNTSEVLKRVSGITIQENKFVVVRGMNDRYNEAMLNNAILPSTEPDRKTFSFDIFPSGVVDNITIIKSATPDLPGDFSGGLIQINTKDIPDENFISLKTGVGYNSLTTFNNFFSYQGGKNDWLGLDDGIRNLPSGFPTTEEYIKMSANDKLLWAKKIPNTWGILSDSSITPNLNMQVVGGFTLRKTKTTKFGGILGVTYNSSYRFSSFQRADYGSLITDTVFNYMDSVYSRNILSSALANFTCKLNGTNKIFFNNIFSINSNNQTVLRTGPNQSSGILVKANSFYFSSNQILNSQFGGDHYFQKIKLRVKWLAYKTSFKRDEPDYRRNTYFTSDDFTPYSAQVTYGTSTATGSGVRYYATVTDETFGGNLDLNFSFQLFKLSQSLKTGASFFNDKRNRDARIFTTAVANSDNFNSNLVFNGQDTIYAPEHYDLQTGFVQIEDNTATNHYDGNNQNSSAYIMLDNKFAKPVRFVWGFRIENFQNTLNTFDVITNEPYQRDTTYLDILPSANLILSVLKNANIRFSFNRAVARPQFRELANQLFYDFLLNTTFNGNPNLVETHINNYEFRWEHYFKNAQYYSASLFYKTFENPIEQTLSTSGGDSRTVQFVNVPRATNIGLEIEGRKDFSFIAKSLENLVAYANVSIIQSKVYSLGTTSDTSANRPLQGQSPYIINTSLQYTEPKSHLGISALYNVIGKRIFLVGSASEEPIWEDTHPTLDIKLSKSFLKDGLVELTWSDILHGNDYQFWDLNQNKIFDKNANDRLIQSQNFGYNLSLAISFKF